MPSGLDQTGRCQDRYILFVGRGTRCAIGKQTLFFVITTEEPAIDESSHSYVSRKLHRTPYDHTCSISILLGWSTRGAHARTRQERQGQWHRVLGLSRRVAAPLIHRDFGIRIRSVSLLARSNTWDFSYATTCFTMDIIPRELRGPRHWLARARLRLRGPFGASRGKTRERRSECRRVASVIVDDCVRGDRSPSIARRRDARRIARRRR